MNTGSIEAQGVKKIGYNVIILFNCDHIYKKHKNQTREHLTQNRAVFKYLKMISFTKITFEA